MAQLVSIRPPWRRPGFNPWVGKIPWKKKRLPTLAFQPREFHGLYCPWGRKESDTTELFSLSLFTLNKISFSIWIAIGCVWVSEKSMAPHSSTLAWKIPQTEEPGGLQSMGSLGVRHNWATSLSLFTFNHWRRKWQPTPVFLPGESQGQGSLVGCRLWGRTESDTTEAT